MMLDAESRKSKAMLDQMAVAPKNGALSRATDKALEILDDAARRPTRISLAEYRDNPKQRKHQKYKNKVTETPDGRFDSEAEYRHWCHLKIRLRLGEITLLKRQVSFELIPKVARPSGGFERPCAYVADFVYLEDGRTVVADVKGASTDTWVLKRKLMLHLYGIEVLEIRA